MWVTHTDYYKGVNWIYSWWDRTSLGLVKISTLLETLMALGDVIVAAPSWIYRVTLLTIIFLANLGSFMYIKHLTKDPAAGLIGAFVYTANPWFLNEILNGHIDILAGVGIFPWLPLCIEKRKPILTAFVATTFLTTVHPQAIYAFGFFSIVYLFVAMRSKKNDVSYALTTFIMTTGLSMFYVMPFVLINGFHGFSGLAPWTIEDISDFVMPLWLVLLSFATVLFLTVLVLKYGKESKYARFYCATAMLATLISVSPSIPILDNVYLWMFRNVPLFSIFRVPTRLLMVTMFCTAYMTGIVAWRTKSVTSKVRMPFHKTAKSRGGIYRIIIVGVIVGTFVISSSVTNVPLIGNYTPDSVWISDYEWLRGQTGDFWNVYTLPVTTGWILTPYGTTQDYGALSTLFSGRPVIGTPGRTTASYPFLKYLEYAVMNNITDQWLKLLGAINVKYVTSGPNVGEQEAFFLRQEGISNDSFVYADNSAKVFANPWWVPMFRVVSDVNLLAGGYDNVVSLSRLSLNFNNSGLCFMDSQENKSVMSCSSLIYEDFMDYVMLTLDNGIKIHAYQFGVDYTRDPKKDWIKEDRWKIEGKFVLNGFTLSISGQHARTIPFEAEENGTYNVFVRTLSGPALDRGYLTVGNATILPSWSDYTFKWYDFREIDVVKGQNLLQLENSGEENDIDEIVLVKRDSLENHSKNIIKELDDYLGKTIFCSKAYNIFNTTQLFGWKVFGSQSDGNGHVLHGIGNTELSLKLVVGKVESDPGVVVVPKTDNYIITLRAKTNEYVVLCIDNETIGIRGNGEYALYTFRPRSLESGTHDIRLYFTDEVYLDDVVICSSIKDEQPLEVFPSEKSNNRITVARKLSPTEYVLNIENGNEQSFLISSISYDNGWKAYLNGTEISPTRMNDVLLGFPINETGSLQIRLVFTGQKYVTLGYSITLASCSAIFAGSLIRHIKTKKRKEKTQCD
jgi:hypothetical protein